MNSLKNLVIIALLGAVGLWVYTSLKRNNNEPGQPSSVAEGWPGAPNVELSGAKLSTSPGGPLALGSGAPASPTTPGFGMGETAPRYVSPATTNPASPLQSGPPAMTPVGPYTSSGSPATASAGSASMPTASLSPPITPDASPTEQLPNASTPTDTVRNLVPPPEVAAAVNPVRSAENSSDRLLQNKFAAFMDAVQKKLDEGKLAEAHLALSSLYGNPDLPAEQAKQITDLLDRLAGTVIYSRQHCLEPAYFTSAGDTLDKIAQKYNIPWQLLGRINGLMPPGAVGLDDPLKDQPLPPGGELKVVRGPFEAVVNLDKHEMTLMVQNRYAGRFPIGVGRDEPRMVGEYAVRNKTPSPVYHGPDGVTINPNDPQNPLGSAWIGLSDRIGIHGTNDPRAVGHDNNRGAICVGDRDLQDLYGILSVGSRVTILR